MLPPEFEYIEISDDEFNTLVNFTLDEYNRVFGKTNDIITKVILKNKPIEKRGRPSKPQRITDTLCMNKAL